MPPVRKAAVLLARLHCYEELEESAVEGRQSPFVVSACHLGCCNKVLGLLQYILGSKRLFMAGTVAA